MKDFYELIEKLEAIKDKGYIKTHRTGNTGIGKTLEDLLGISENNIPGPNVEGRLIERRWQSNGEEKRKMEIIASIVRFLSKKKDSQDAVPEEHTDLEPF